MIDQREDDYMSITTEIYCDSCINLIEHNTCTCKIYNEKPVSVLSGGICYEYIRHKDKELNNELCERLDLAIASRFDFSLEEYNSCKIIESQCSNCIYQYNFDCCTFFNKSPDIYVYPSKNVKCPERIEKSMNINSFKDNIRKLQEQILTQKELVHNEENTKQALISPFFLLLGYDVHDPSEVEFEFNASFSYKNSDKVDYAIKSNGKPIFFVEAKKVTEDLSNHYAQLEYYLSTNSDVEIGILTNGIVYKFFAYFEKQKTMDKEPFFEINFENISDEQIETLALFCKDGLDINTLLKKGEELWYYKKITQKLRELLTKPNDDFIRLLAKDYYSTKMTANALEKFRPIVNKAITTAVTDITQETIVDEITEDKSKTIITTDNELKAFDMVKDILSKAGKDISDIDYKDIMSYFAIYKRNINGWFVRFILDLQPTLAMLNIEYTLVKDIPTELKIQPLTSKGITKVFIDSVDDITKLEQFILKAFERVE